MTTRTWIENLEGLSDHQPLRAMQIALAAIDEALVADEVGDKTGLTAAYEELQAAISAETSR